MPKTVQKTLTFPLAGVSRRRGYREQQRPYAAPWAVNVRGVGPFESRGRGGSRPGLSKVHANDFGSVITAINSVTSVDSSGNLCHDLVIIADGIISYLRASSVVTPTARLLWPNGDVVLWENGDVIVFDSTVSAASPIGPTDAYDTVERNGKLYIADSVLRVFNPQAGNVEVVEGTPPAGLPTIALYRDRIFLSGVNHQWFCCRQSDVTDWDFGGYEGNKGRAVAGQLEEAGLIGAAVKAMIPYKDNVLLFACADSLWVLRGDPTTGTLRNLSTEIGIIGPDAYALTPDGRLVFLSNNGLYMWNMGSDGAPVPFSDERVPEELKNVSPTTNTITMAYDATGQGVHLFLTPTTGTGTHWWVDLDNKALWPVILQADHEPLAIGRIETNGLGEVVIGCSDGYLRKFAAANTSDDGTAISSHILLGPFRISRSDTEDAVLQEIHGIMASNAGVVTWQIYAGENAEAVTDAAVTGINAVLAGGSPTGVAASGTWAANRNKVERARVRGAWIVVWLYSVVRWSYEAVAVTALQQGRLR